MFQKIEKSLLLRTLNTTLNDPLKKLRSDGKVQILSSTSQPIL